MKTNRSNWKVPFIASILFSNFFKTKKIIKLYKRNSVISAANINKTFSIYNGKNWIKLLTNKDMINHKYGEFALTKIIGFKEKKNKKTGRKMFKK